MIGQKDPPDSGADYLHKDQVEECVMCYANICLHPATN